MIWMTFVSFRRNIQKYALSIISLALAVAVSCLGLSGLDLLWRATLRPLTFVGGGQVMIMDERTSLRPAGSRVYADPQDIKPYPSLWAEEIVLQVLGSDSAVRTLVVPFVWYGENGTTIFYLAGRDNLPNSLAELPLLQGRQLGPDSVDTQLLVPGTEWRSGGGSSHVGGWFGMTTGSMRPLTIPQVMDIGGVYEWDMASSVEQQYIVTGIYSDRAALYPLLWSTLNSLQGRLGGEQLVSWVGISCASDQMDSLKASLEAEIAERGLPLKVLTVVDLGRMLLGDFEKFERMAAYYSPVMLFVAVQIVLVNAIALALTRRKELALLRTIGFSLRQIQLMFVTECFFSALVGGLLGTALASGLALGMAKNASVSYTPFILTLITTTVVSSITTLVLTSGSLSQVLRNPAS